MILEGKKLTYIIVSAVTIIAVVFTVAYSLIKNGVFADSANNYYDQIKLSNDLDDDKKDEQINVNVEKLADKFTFTLEIMKNKKQVSSFALSGFESNVSFCPDPILILDGSKVICIQGFVGAHAQNIQMVKYSSTLESVKFSRDGRLLENIVTDAPNFDFVKESGNITGIYLDNRNYAKDPLVDIIRSHYYLSSGVFAFSNNEEIKMSEPVETNSSGRIN